MAEVIKQRKTDFPDDVLIEIFLKLPVRSLFIFRSVSKHWLNLIQNPNFISLHINRPINNLNDHQPMLTVRILENEHEPENRKLLLMTLLSDDETLAYNDDVALEVVSPSMALTSLCLDEDRLHLLGPCNGLFCLSDSVDVVLFNPSTRQCRNVPLSPFCPLGKGSYRISAIGGFDCVGFGFVSNDYKVVRFDRIHDEKFRDDYVPDDHNDHPAVEVDNNNAVGVYYDEYDFDDFADAVYNQYDCHDNYNVVRDNEIVGQEFEDNNDYGEADDDGEDDDFEDDDVDDDDIEDDDFEDDDQDSYYHDLRFKVEIYSLTTNCWRQLDGVVPSCDIFKIHGCNMFFNGAFHWVVGDHHSIGSILVFDLNKEGFKQFELPERYHEEDDSRVYLSVLNESLATVGHMGYYNLRSDVDFKIWVMKEYGDNRSWKKLYNISPDVGIERPLSFNKEEFLIENKDGQLISYNLKTKTIKKFQVDGVRRSLHAFRYRESLVSLK